MRILTAFVTALTLIGFAGAASANCNGMHSPQQPDQTAEKPILIPPENVGS